MRGLLYVDRELKRGPMSSAPGSNEQTLPVLAVFSPPPVPDCIEQSMSAMKAVPSAQFELAITIATMSQLFDVPSGRGVILINLRNKEDLLGTLNLISKHQVKMRKGLIKVIVVEQMKDRKVTEVLQSKGVKEIVGAKLPARSLLHKIQTSLQVVERTWVRASQADDAKTNSFGSGKKPAPTGGPASTQNRVDWVPALLLSSDFWLIEGKPGAKRVLGRWMVELMGPGPSAGAWVPIRLSPDAPAGVSWEWKGKPTEGSNFSTPEGRWIFFGREPNFDWKSLRWRLVSDRPRLAYYENKATKPLVFRFDTDPAGLVTIAENSPQAKSRMPEIQKSLEADVRLKAVESAKDRSAPEGQAQGDGEASKTEDDWGDLGMDLEPEPKSAGKGMDWAQFSSTSREKEKKPAEWTDHVKKDEEKEPAEWGDHVTEDEAPADWNDHVKKADETTAEWGDHVTEDPEPIDWGGDAKKDNIFKSDGGLSLGGKGKRKPQERDGTVTFAADTDDDEDYGGDAKSDKNLASTHGLGKRNRSSRPQDQGSDLSDDTGLPGDELAARRKEKKAALESKQRAEEMREALGEVDSRWASGEDAFKSIKLVTRIKDALKGEAAEWSVATFLEQRETMVWVEIPTDALGAESIGLLELITVDIDQKETAVQVPARVVMLEDAGDGITIFQGQMQPAGADRLRKIVERFESRQEELLNFFSEAKGEPTGT